MLSAVVNYNETDLRVGIIHRIPNYIYNNKELMDKIQPLIDKINTTVFLDQINKLNKDTHSENIND